ncbi:Tol-Pal system beta propeller repeat protein TolB [Thermomonas sp. LB-4]|uniref:Tol-Pal system beta propeller repeat protein TolB n=1 Tax=Thermomonas sp. LB-4 TaxID=3102790 RepID=UPI002EDAF20A
MKRIARRLLVPLLLLPACTVLAQSRSLEIDIVGGNAAALPITVVPFGGSCGDTDVGGVVRADLGRSGQFRSPDPASLPERPTQGSEVAYPTWRMLKQDYLLIGRCVPGGGGYRTEYELFDVAKQERLLGFALTAPAGAMRDVAHQIADAVYEKILGVPGAFWTRIAYVTASGLGRSTRYALVVADADGYNPRTVVNSTEPLLSPSWSPDGRKLAYVSFEGGNSGIWIQDIATGSRDKVTSFRGINGAPAFSPDGSRLAMTLSKGGNPDIYVMDLGSKHLTQLTNHFGIDTEPTWSHDGASLYFTSDRGGRPQIYQMPASGGSATRVSFDGSYNASPSVSFDGKKLATAQGAGNTYRIALMDRSTGGARWSMLSPGSLDESPSFAPNGAMLLYAAREGRRGVLYAVSADGRVRQRLSLGDGDVREPAWSPYRKR